LYAADRVEAVASTNYVVLALGMAWVLGLVAVNLAKGKFWWAVLSLLGILWPFTLGAAIRLARPDSWWARHLYDERALARSQERFRSA
jgi:hypothetical protein